MRQDFVFTCESVTEGHPDKLCDQISDGVVDRFLQRDPHSRVVVECAVANGIVFIASHFASAAMVDVADVARQVIAQVGYDDRTFNARSCTVMTSLTELDAANRVAVDEAELDDDGIERVVARHAANAFGYACAYSPAMIPEPLWLAHKLARRLASMRLQRRAGYLGPDAKVQVGVEFRNRVPHRVHSLTLATSIVSPDAPRESALREALTELVIAPAFVGESLQPDDDTRIFINPEGAAVAGGPTVHSGLTGRKNAVDTYGEYSRHSGAALSGKDPSRVDRIGTYAARYAAKNVVAAGLAKECEVHLSYVIGQARPLGVQVETYGTGKVSEDEIAARLVRHLELRPAGIVAQFRLRRLPSLFRGGFFRRLAAYGHVGRLDIGLPWEQTNKAQLLAEG
jgi:S-adenosylmethionine synthetase